MNKEKLKEKVKKAGAVVGEKGRDFAEDLEIFVEAHPFFSGLTAGVWLFYLAWFYIGFIKHRGEVIDDIIWRKK